MSQNDNKEIYKENVLKSVSEKREKEHQGTHHIKEECSSSFEKKIEIN